MAHGSVDLIVSFLCSEERQGVCLPCGSAVLDPHLYVRFPEHGTDRSDS